MGTSVVFLLFTNFVNLKNRAIKFVGDSLLIFWTHDIIFLLFQLQSSSPRELNHGSRGLLLFLHIPISLSCHGARGIAGGARGKETWDSDSIPGSGRSPEGGMKNIPVFLPGESHGQRSLVGFSPWGCKELDVTEQLTHRVGSRPLLWTTASMPTDVAGIAGVTWLTSGNAVSGTQASDPNPMSFRLLPESLQPGPHCENLCFPSQSRFSHPSLFRDLASQRLGSVFRSVPNFAYESFSFYKSDFLLFGEIKVWHELTPGYLIKKRIRTVVLLILLRICNLSGLLHLFKKKKNT